MISDTLSQALEEIKIYRRDYPSVYGTPGMSAGLDGLVSVMEAFRKMLDTPTPVEAPIGGNADAAALDMFANAQRAARRSLWDSAQEAISFRDGSRDASRK